MHDLPILVNITVALVAAFAGGIVARLLKLPPMVGYLLGGVAIGPFTPGYTGNADTIRQLAEMGIAFLMFGVGLHFSLHDLWVVRRIAFPGALLQLLILAPLVILVTTLWGWSFPSALIVGLAVPIATSTVVMLRNLMDQGLLNTSQGKAVIGWLVLEDLITVLILVLVPTLSSHSSGPIWQTISLALLKAAAFAAIMLIAGTRLIPALLRRLSLTASREIFIVAIVLVALGTAIAASAFFGVSLALGAFLAGAVINETTLSQQVESEILPFRETFTVLFFVSIGMLVNPLHLIGHLPEIAILAVIVIVGKYLLTLIMGIVLKWPERTTLVLAAGRGQIGEFAFILGETGVAVGLLAEEQYSILLAGAIVSIIVNPFVFRTLPATQYVLRKMPALLSRMQQQPQQQEVSGATYHDHVVIVGFGRVGEHIIKVLGQLQVPRLVVDLNVQRINTLNQKQIPTLYGDVANSDILAHAQVDKARAVVVTIPDETAAEIAIMNVRRISSEVPVIVRATTQEGLHRLFARGATAVIQPELEGGLEIVSRTLSALDFPREQIDEYTDCVRNDLYDTSKLTPEEQHALEQIAVRRPR
ncbi:cation:proton antiporter [Dictyobacter aurantiacus]|uniref:Sodium/hydrogen exchanger n=1 Tax=Dictyobacter aurantiacus TaxID=1936993 RepID=A0A401ZPZ5_9CHLR|nr:cation:proton antiporter [Dictyobacter aurantiacus]GCE08978.1 sodium/hydrogen exchanger [Dictyobacter aurantiacus]